MERKVTCIPAKPKFYIAENKIVKKKVAGYARVSTDSDEQLTSYEAQVNYYTEYISNHPDWEFVKVYTDEGISGLGTKYRQGFNEMIADAMDGKINLIITKSVSRFARNTVDTLTTIRKLKDKNIEVYFEKENIWTLDSKGELLITIMSSLAQEESRSISENVTWSCRRRFAEGKMSLGYKTFLGYDRGPTKDSPPVINEEQAKIVRRIYSRFMQGISSSVIADELMKDGIPAPGGGKKWAPGTINNILKNEKYRGSALLQKSFTVDFLTKKKKVNEGEVPQYYIEHNHEPIIDPEEWNAVQDEIQRRKIIGREYTSKDMFFSKLICGECGHRYGMKIWHSTDKYRKNVWTCNFKYKNKEKFCSTRFVVEGEIKQGFVNAYNSLFSDKEAFIDECEAVVSDVISVKTLESKRDEILKKINEIDVHIQENLYQYSDNNKDSYENYTKQYDELKKQYDDIDEKIKKAEQKKRQVGLVLKEIRARDGLLEEFDEGLWCSIVEKAVVQVDGNIVYYFKDGNSYVYEHLKK